MMQGKTRRRGDQARPDSLSSIGIGDVQQPRRGLLLRPGGDCLYNRPDMSGILIGLSVAGAFCTG